MAITIGERRKFFTQLFVAQFMNCAQTYYACAPLSHFFPRYHGHPPLSSHLSYGAHLSAKPASQNAPSAITTTSAAMTGMGIPNTCQRVTLPRSKLL